jgi:hypothetical protein
MTGKRTVNSRILTPEETTKKNWVAVIESWHVPASSREHAERIIATCEMCMQIGRRDALARVRNALEGG